MKQEKARLIDLPKIVDPRGNLTVAEQMKNIPFDIARVYWTYDVPSGERRGGHAHRTCEEIVIAVSGSFDVTVDDGQGGTEDKTYLYTYELTAGKFAYDVTLWSAIKGAAKNLLAKANVFDGNEIYAQKVGVHHKELGLPMVTPQFALFYRLVYAGDFTVTLTAKEEQQP